MSTDSKTTMLYNVDPDDLKQIIKESMSFNPDKFYNVMINQEMFCLIHSLSRTTLYRYLKAGIVVPDSPRESKEYRFRLSEVLKLDMEAIKYKHNQLHLVNSKNLNIKKSSKKVDKQ